MIMQVDKARLDEIPDDEVEAGARAIAGTAYEGIYFTTRTRKEYIEAEWRNHSTDARTAIAAAAKARSLRSTEGKERAKTASVPLDPTDEMIAAGVSVDFSNEDERATVINVWHAMVAARAEAAQMLRSLRSTEGKDGAKTVAYLIDCPIDPCLEFADVHVPDAAIPLVRRSDLEAAEAHEAKLTAALEPFAALYVESMRDFPDGSSKTERPDDKQAWGFNNVDLTWGDFRRAAALTRSPE